MASIASSAHCRNHPAKSPVTPPKRDRATWRYHASAKIPATAIRAPTARAHATIPAAEAAAKAQSGTTIAARFFAGESPAAMPSARAAGQHSTASPESARENTSEHRSARNTPAVSGSAVNRENCRIRYTTTPMTPKAPARGSCMISSFRSRGAQLASASEVSQSPSRWMPPVTATGSATSTAATMVAGMPSRFATCPHAVMRKPSASPTRGNAASAWVDPKSVQADFGTGMRENVPNAAPIASAIFTL